MSQHPIDIADSDLVRFQIMNDDLPEMIWYSGVLDLEAIIDTILTSRGMTEILVVSHGSGDGLAIPIRRGSPSGAQSAIIVAFASESQGEDVSFDGSKIKDPGKVR